MGKARGGLIDEALALYREIGDPATQHDFLVATSCRSPST